MSFGYYPLGPAITNTNERERNRRKPKETAGKSPARRDGRDRAIVGEVRMGS